MTPLQAALRDKYGTPDKALEALGLPATLLATDGADPAGPLLTALRRSPKMNATAERVHAALTAILIPHLAADAQMPDLGPVVKGVTRGNLGKSKNAIWARAKVAAKGHLAKDQAGPDDVAIRILDMIDKQGAAGAEAEAEPVEGQPPADNAPPPAAPPPAAATEPSAAPPPAAAAPKPKPTPAPAEGEAEPVTEDGEEHAAQAEILKALGEKLGDDDLAQQVYDICMGTGDQDPPPAAPAPSASADPPPATDEEEAPMMKPAMDAAIKTAVTQAKADMRAEAKAALEARAAVRPWVGDVSVAYDTAQEIYKAALDSLGVKVKGVHPSAYRTILENIPKPGSSKKLAMDGIRPGKARPSGSGKSDLARRFPHAAGIQILG
jgi:hypothetical protein